MRALFTVQPSIGHLHPLVPIARALDDAGHDVAVCSSPAFRAEVESFGLTHIDAGLDWHTSDQSTWAAFPPMPPPGPERSEEHTSELQSLAYLVCRLLLEKKKKQNQETLVFGFTAFSAPVC